MNFLSNSLPNSVAFRDEVIVINVLPEHLEMDDGEQKLVTFHYFIFLAPFTFILSALYSCYSFLCDIASQYVS